MKKNIRQLTIRKLPSQETESKAKDELGVLVTALNYQYLALCTVYKQEWKSQYINRNHIKIGSTKITCPVRPFAVHEQSYIHLYMITVS